MANTNNASAVIVIFGASGDLTRRKIIPALYDLYADGLLPEEFTIIGVARTPMARETFSELLYQGVQQHARQRELLPGCWAGFAARLTYHALQYDCADSYQELFRDLRSSRHKQASHIFYLATPPGQFPVIAEQLGNHKAFVRRSRSRIVIEKPFGHDLASALALNTLLLRFCQETQIFRIDHYLGKETVQNIMAFRFANSMWEPVWNRRYIDCVQITVAEKVGVGHRGGYFEGAGALRDMVQNHLLQVLCLVAMEPPVSFAADEIRNKTVDVLHALRPIAAEDVPHRAVRGQYGGNGGQTYRQEQGVGFDSKVETFAAVTLYIDNWRWHGVPFYLRTGKCLPERVSEVAVQFRPVPHQPFQQDAAQPLSPNRLAIQMGPTEGILLRTQAKQPGLGMVLKPVEMGYSYSDVFRCPSRDAYETLLADVLRGDPSLFMRADQVKAAWLAISPILEEWQKTEPADFPNYEAGSWGPKAAERLTAQNGHQWIMPAYLEQKQLREEC